MPDPRMLLVDEDVCFRYRLVSAVVALEIGGTAKSAAVRAVAGSAQVDEAGRPRHVSERTLYRWVAAYAEHGLPGLVRARRQRLVGSAVLPDGLLTFLDAERALDRDASIPELLRRAELREVIAATATQTPRRFAPGPLSEFDPLPRRIRKPQSFSPTAPFASGGHRRKLPRR